MVSLISSEIFYATSYDMDHPPEFAIDGDDNTFWVTTGLFPQELVIRFKRPSQITRITVTCGNVKQYIVNAATDEGMSEWVQIDDTSLPGKPVKLSETHQINFQQPAYGVSVKITKGWGQFAAIYQVRVEGPSVRDAE